MKPLFNNPFVNCTARDMSYADVMNFWCSPYDCYKINEEDLKLSATPIIIEGARGSGKTMILKHLSYYCQKETYAHQKLLEGVSADKYLGFYFRYSADYSTLFDSLSCSKKYRESLFERYFHLCVGLEIARVLKDLEEEFTETEKQSLFASMSSLLSSQIENSQALIDWLVRSIQRQDETIRRSQFEEAFEPDDKSINSFLFEIIALIQNQIQKLSDVLFIIIIDEYENVGIYQSVINTYIKQMEGSKKYTFRIGVRPEGIKDYLTNVSQEFLQDGRDFIKKQLTVKSDDRTTTYKKFVKDVINKRLRKIPVFLQQNISIDSLLGARENYDWEAKRCVGNRKEHFSEALANKTAAEREMILSTVSDQNPIIEAYFLMRLRRGDSIQLIKQIKDELLNKKETTNTRKYKLDLQDKYKPALLFWLLDIYKTKKMYYSFPTFLYLSCGSIYDFIGLCRTVFDELESDFFEKIETNTCVPYNVQSKASIKYAQSQLEKVRINHDYGSQMFHFVQNMCNLFRYYHKGDLCIRYPETNQFYISGNFESAGVDQEIWRSLLRWGIVVKKTSFQRASLAVNSHAQLYYINKSYYPVFGISCRIRGGFNIGLSNEMWHKMTTSLVEPTTVVRTLSKKKKGKGENARIADSAGNTMPQQLNLFDLEAVHE